MEMGAPKDFATKLQAGTGASHIKSFIRYLKEFEFEKPLGEHAPDPVSYTHLTLPTSDLV